MIYLFIESRNVSNLLCIFAKRRCTRLVSSSPIDMSWKK